MASRNKMLDHLKKHFLYEVTMLGHSYDRLYNTNCELEWNAFLNDFAVHARLLIDFLQNADDTRNFKASDYVPDYEWADMREEGVDTVVTWMNDQIFHFGKHRTTDQAKKSTLSGRERNVGDTF